MTDFDTWGGFGIPGFQVQSIHNQKGFLVFMELMQGGGKINPSFEAPNAGNEVVLGTATIWLGPEPTQIIGLI